MNSVSIVHPFIHPLIFQSKILVISLKSLLRFQEILKIREIIFSEKPHSTPFNPILHLSIHSHPLFLYHSSRSSKQQKRRHCSVSAPLVTSQCRKTVNFIQIYQLNSTLNYKKKGWCAKLSLILQKPCSINHQHGRSSYLYSLSQVQIFVADQICFII